jgi:nucleoside recognition membrane protein YjiH
MNSLRFVLSSALGVLIFLTPVPWEGRLTIVINILSGAIKSLMGDYALPILLAILCIASALTLIATLFRPAFIVSHAFVRELFVVSPVWLVLRLLGAAFGLMYFFQIGPAVLLSEELGGAVFVGIGINVLCVYTAACFLLPLLTDFGLMEFVGTLAKPVFQRLFRLPGSSAVDALTSFIGASAIGLLITIKQYESGHYTAREATVIATNFSVVSIPFSVVIAQAAGIEHLFISWYGVVVIACLQAALITPRLPPLSRKEHVHFGNAAPNSRARSTSIGYQQSSESAEAPHEPLKEAWMSALSRAETAPNVRQFIYMALGNLLFFLVSVTAATMALATLAALVTIHTPLLVWLSHPLIALLELARLPEATQAAPGLLAGYLDQYMPAIVAGSIESTTTSFVLAGLAVCQLIFMSESGVIMLRSSLPLSLTDLTLIFLVRTIIVLPVLIAGAHLLT